jgi:hypothetical protein
MAHHLVRVLCLTTLSAALFLQGCGKSSPGSLDRSPRLAPDRAAATDRLASRPDPLYGRTASGNLTAAIAPSEHQAEDDPPPWLAELLHATDPNVRIQALDAWAKHPGASLDPVTYALVDSDEAVRARAQDVLEQELARR